MSKVITGAVIKITTTKKPSGTATEIGRAMALSVQEVYRVIPVFGIGTLTARELPVLQYSGAFTMQQFAFSTTALKNLMDDFDRPSAAASKDAFIRELLYNDGVDVTVTYKTKNTATGATTPEVTNGLLLISGAVCQSESITIQENQIALRDGTFMFAEPITVA